MFDYAIIFVKGCFYQVALKEPKDLKELMRIHRQYQKGKDYKLIEAYLLGVLPLDATKAMHFNGTLTILHFEVETKKEK